MATDEFVEISKKKYLAEVKRNVARYDALVIYGGGWIAKILFDFLREFDIPISAFCVTDKSVNRKEIHGVPVIQIDELPFDKNTTLILVGVKEPRNKEVIAILEKEYWNYIDVPDNAIDFDDSTSFVSRPLLEITTQIGCPVNCKYCPQETLYQSYFDRPGRTRRMTFASFKQCIDKLPKDTMLAFAGFVEPFLNFECAKMMEYASRKGFTLRLNTTLVGCTKDIFEGIRDIPFNKVVLHTPDAEGYANIPMTPEYFEVLDLVLSATKTNGQPWVDTANCQSRPHPDVLRHIDGRVLVSSNLFDRAGNLSDENLWSVKNIEGKIYCARSKDLKNSVLLPDGRMVLCCMDFGMKHILGNLLEQSYEEIINDDEINLIRTAMMSNSKKNILCRNCTHARKL